ncbi:MAG: AAA family ATPase [Thermonemataceae bacterium]|nr:AAA family ATPase [Thermonemataceae bacterium]
MADKILDKNYKFKDLLVYSSNESFEGNKKKYRRVFENKETTYIYVELSFFNKLFDEEDWDTNIALKAFKLNSDGGRKELCNLPIKKTIKKDENIVIIRESWGNDVAGDFWKRGDYEWEAYIDNEKVSSRRFYVEEGGLVQGQDNPYFDVDTIKLYNGPYEGLSADKRVYVTQFDAQETQYIFAEFSVKNRQTKSWYAEVFFRFYNDAGQLKGETSELRYVAPNEQTFTLTSGWGANNKGTWFIDKYRLEVIFMDQLIAVVPFEVGNSFVEGFPTVHKPEAGSIFTGFSSTNNQQREQSLEEVMQELQEMIGLDSVKEKIKDYMHYLKFLKLRQDQGFEESTQLSLHSVFMGNPGTGKTTLAKMLGKIYHKMGLLSKGTVLEVGRPELVGKFIGQTAPKVQEMIEKARGGILFIDEAYSLARKGDQDGQDFGKEVIEVLIKEMSDGKGDLAIIVAGYPAEMDIFLDSNPGLKSRFNLVYNFPDYLPQELMQILDLKAQKKNVEFTTEARDYLKKQLTEAYRNRDNAFGNARLVTSWVEEAKMNLGLRIMKSGNTENLTGQDLKMITLEDVKNILKSKKPEIPEIGVDEELLHEAMDELNFLIGMRSVKDEIIELVKLVRFYRETGKDVLNKFSLHTVFTGNPGTGKTTVARIISKVYKALGVLERGHCIETDRQGLVAGYVGQTALKTTEKINQALGGILFIDEAYALTQGHENDFGKEAVETLLKQMEDKRGQFAVIVAGYPDNMKQFLQANPGLASRFDITIKFDDYTVDELLEIAIAMFKQENLNLDEEAIKHLKVYFDYLYQKRDKFFGNARTVRKVVSQAVKNQHLRMASMPKEQRSEEMIHTLIVDDIKEFNENLESSNQGSVIGFKLGNTNTSDDNKPKSE